MENKNYLLPKLPFGYKDLEPYISEEQLKIHYEKHHNAYVLNSNQILEKIDKARKEGADFDAKAELKSLSFNIGGHILHSLFWENLIPTKKQKITIPEKLVKLISENFINMQRFKKELINAAMSIEGSGWVALTFCSKTNRLILMQIEKHNVNIYPDFKILLVIDAFEHAYYIDYKNEKGKYFENIWEILNWGIIYDRYEKIN